MIEIQRCLVKSIRNSISRCCYRYFSKAPDDVNKTETKKDCEISKKICDTTKSPVVENVDKVENVKVVEEIKSRVINYETFIPDRKGAVKVCIIGGGESSIYTAILLKQSRLIKSVHLVDPKNSMAGAVLDASHIDTSTRVKFFKRNQARKALKETNIIALMDETDSCAKNLDPQAQFESVSAYVHEMADQMVQVCSESLVAVFVRPVTATLPMISEMYRLAGWWDPDRIVGSTALDCMRMEAATANLLDLNPEFLSVPMVGGGDSSTIIPLLSCATPINRFNNAQQEMLLQSLRGADREMAHIESRGPILSAGAAAARLILALASGLSGFENVVSCAFVRSNVLPVCRYFTSELKFGAGGVLKNFGLPKMSPSEIALVEQAIPFINEYIAMGVRAASLKTHMSQKSI